MDRIEIVLKIQTLADLIDSEPILSDAAMAAFMEIMKLQSKI